MPIPVRSSRHRREPARIRIYNTLCEWITYGPLMPGERLNDQEIGEFFEVSRTPVREALQMLEAQKLVVIFPNRATCVSEINDVDLGKWFLPLAHLHALAAKIACAHITGAQVDELREMDREIGRYVEQGDIVKTLKTDLRLHNRLLEIAGNEFISEFSETLMLHIQRIEFMFFKKTGMSRENFVSHEKLLDTLEQRDEDAAFNEMIANWLTILDQVKQRE